jgi:hypothetical protein
MSDILEALNNKIKVKARAGKPVAQLQEAVASLPCLSNDSLTEAEAKEACETLAPVIGEGSFIMGLICAKVRKVEKILTKIKPKKKAKLEAVPKSDED